MKNKKILHLFIVFSFVIVIGIIYSNYKLPSFRSHKVFGVTYMTMNNPFYEIINNELKKSIESQGDILITLDPALDVDKQNEQIYRFIDKKVDGIFINPIDSQKIQPALKAAKDAHIPVIIVDAPVSDSTLVESTIVSDNYDAGVQCAQDMMSRMDNARIILLKHSTVQSAKDRIDGFIDTIQNHPQYQIVNSAECEGQLEKAMPLMQEMLQQTHDVDVVMTLNDPSALGVLAALESSQIKDVIVYGVDGTPDLKSLIQDNPMVAGTVAQSPIMLGQIASKNMYAHIAGEKIESEIIIPVTLIHKKNLSEFDTKGWQ